VRDLWPEGAIQLGILNQRLLVRAARAFEGLCYSSASRIVALSEGMASWIRGQYGFQNIVVVPNASDNELFGRANESASLPAWAKGKFLVVYTGTLGVANDCAQILDTAGDLQRRGASSVEFVILGDGKHREQLKEKARIRGLHNVRFLGIVPRNEWRLWLKRAGCVLVVYKSGFVMDTASPNKLFDAFAAGSPVIQTTEGWIKDLFVKEGCGLNVRPDSPAQMADAILSLLKDSELRERIRSNSSRVGRELFDRDLLSSRMLEVLYAAATEGNQWRFASSRAGRVS
jgi:glycosyltransferase involved in cell wall biosynthesis